MIDFINKDFLAQGSRDFDAWIADGREHFLLLQAKDGRTVAARASIEQLADEMGLSVLIRACASRADDGPAENAAIHRLADILAVCVLTSNGAEIDQINPFGARFLGARDMTQIVGQPLSAFLSDETLSSILAHGRGDKVEDGRLLASRVVGLDGKVNEVSLSVLPCGATNPGSFVIEMRELARQQQLEESRRLALALFQATSEGIALLDAEFQVVRVNAAFTRITGYEESELRGALPDFVARAEDDLKERIVAAIDHNGRWQSEGWASRKNGEEYAERLTVSGIAAPDGNGFSRFVVVIADVTQTKHDEERIRYQANYDALTGLPNRVLFMDRLWQALHLAGRSGQRVCLMYIDLDAFKLVNDTLGHEIGDELLKEAAKRLLFCVRHGDTVARLGGDEFSIIMPNLGEVRHASLIAQRMIETLEQPFLLGGRDAFISASIGITIFPDDAADAHGLLRNADAAMYRAKEEGKANYKFFTADINAEINERMVIRNGLSKALERDEFLVYYQPKCDLATGRLTGVEALLRWRNEAMGGIVSPVKFIPVMEETGLIGTVGEWVLDAACREHRRWRDAGHPEMRVAVNLSARQLRQPDLPQMVERALVRAGIEPGGIELEITESMIMRDTENAVEVLQRLCDMGIHLAMDDFGTGYSSLSYLKRFPVHTIKIDRSFVADIATDPDDQEIIHTIISMGHSLRRKVIAEGVETEEQRILLRKMRCDEMQGYLLSRPVPAEEIDRMLLGIVAPR